MSRMFREDLYGYVNQLRNALADPALDEFETGSVSPAAAQAAAQVAIALGYCRIFGLDAGEDDGILPVREALAAIEALKERVQDLTHLVTTLPARWDAAAPSEEADSYCLDILELRMDLWVATIALGEAAVDATLDGDPQADLLGQQLDQLMTEIEQLDNLIRQEDIMMLLSTVAGSPLLQNWRTLLVEPYTFTAPYWIDGSLEAFDEKSKKELVEQTIAPLHRPKQVRRARPESSGQRWAAEVIRSLRSPIAVAAEAPVTGAPYKLLQWASPDGKYTAQLPLPAQPISGESLTLTIFRGDSDEEAVELVGVAVSLAGVTGKVSEKGQVQFSLEELRQAVEAGTPADLVVSGETWQELPPRG